MTSENQPKNPSYNQGQRGRPVGWRGTHVKRESSVDNSHRNTLTIRTSYKYYIEKCKQKGIVPVYINDYVKIHDFLIKKIQDRIIKGDCINLNQSLGKIQIQESIPFIKRDKDGNVTQNTFPINWKATNELKEKTGEYKLIRYLNEHTSGAVYKIRHLKPRNHSYHFNVYKVRPTKTLKKLLIKAINHGKRYAGKKHY